MGLPLSREDKWIDATVNFTTEVMSGREAFIKQPAIIRFFAACFLPEVKSLKRYGKQGATLLRLLIKQALAREAIRKPYEDNSQESERGTLCSMVFWLKYISYRSVQVVADKQMPLSFV